MFKRKKNDDDLEFVALDGYESESVKKKEKNRTFETVLVTYFFVFLMLLVMGNLVLFVTKDSESVINNSYNTRQEILANKNIRGKILSRDGDILAQTGRNEEGKEIRYYPY